MKRNFFIIMAFGLIAPLRAQPTAQKADDKATPQKYIETYKYIAISEMERTGVPASITLAQGIAESRWGTSSLATEANNHFGIKCAKDWMGLGYHRWDDDPTKSCFRKYRNAADSYTDHSDFLLGRSHYRFLFEYDKTDYKKWAHGLKKAGYATDPTYPDKLISTIEQYKLHQYDLMSSPPMTIEPPGSEEIYAAPEFSDDPVYRSRKRSALFKEYKKGIFRKNEVSYVIARKNESALSLADRFGIPYKKFLKFNDLKENEELYEYQFAFIQPKRSEYSGTEEFHTVQTDETLYSISQFYGVTLESLRNRNMIPANMEPAPGEVVMLKNSADKPPKLRPKTAPSPEPPAREKPLATPLKDTDDPAVFTPILESEPLPVKPNVKSGGWEEEPEPVVDPNKYQPDKVGMEYINTGKNGDKSMGDRPFYEEVKPVELPDDSQELDKLSRPKDEHKEPVKFPTKTTSGPRKHTVATSETLYRISKMYGVSVAAIREANNMDETAVLRVGMDLIIPE